MHTETIHLRLISHHSLQQTVFSSFCFLWAVPAPVRVTHGLSPSRCLSPFAMEAPRLHLPPCGCQVFFFGKKVGEGVLCVL